MRATSEQAPTPVPTPTRLITCTAKPHASDHNNNNNNTKQPTDSSWPVSKVICNKKPSTSPRGRKTGTLRRHHRKNAPETGPFTSNNKNKNKNENINNTNKNKSKKNNNKK
ncbi:unnamed protein product [Polarella glacialis]|uniref:Uncharacterized protein n=1 Tax=Polarella glacialis TaxID=89957 RepID=A0A813GDD5_POLGL|nr:unnamed protein product [Polarella glacialis]